MKNNLMRITSLLIALTVFLCCLTACGKKESKEEITKNPVEIETPPPEDLVNLDDYMFTDDPNEESDVSDDTLTTSEDESTTNRSHTVTNTRQDSSNKTTDKTTDSDDRSPSDNQPTAEPNVTVNRKVTREDLISLLNAAGYVYDAEQDIYYTHMNPWQRRFGFGSQYDTAAGYLNMEYMTFKCDFTYGDKYWRIQCWKGQYALLCGAEMGVYTKDIDSDLSKDFYACANDDNLLEMGFDFYKTTKDYNERNRLFYRPLEYHWWQTGFKFGYCNPKKCVAVMTIRAKDSEMADEIEKGLLNVKGKNGGLNPFYKYGSSDSYGKSNLYQRKGNEIKIIWLDAGYTNYSGEMF